MVGRRKPLGDTMYQLLLLPTTRSPCKNYHLHISTATQPLEAWWESRATPHTGARLYNGRATISEFRPKFLVAALLYIFCGYTGHWSPCPVPLTTFPQPFFLLIRSWTIITQLAYLYHLPSPKSSAMFPAWTSSLWSTRP